MLQRATMRLHTCVRPRLTVCWFPVLDAMLLSADCQLQVEFQQTDRLGQEPHEEPRQFDVATCMFAIHYFFDKAETLKTLLATIASNLKPGGRSQCCNVLM